MVKDIIIDLELASACNLSCSYCPRSSIKRKTKFVGDEIIENLVECIGSEQIVWFSGLGEPFLHPRIEDITKRLKTSGAKIYSNTNGSISQFEKKIIATRENGLDFVNVSVYGLDNESYKEVTGKPVFDRVRFNIEVLKEREIPFRLSHVTNSNSPLDIKSKLQNTFDTEHIRIWNHHNRALGKSHESTKECGINKYYLFVTSDGNVLPCVNDVLQKHVFGKNFLEASEKKRSGFPYDICKYCDDPMSKVNFDKKYFEKVFKLSE